MHCLLVASFVACVAVVSAQTFVNPERHTVGKVSKINQPTVRQGGLKKNDNFGHTKMLDQFEQQPYVVGADHGIHPLFNGPNPKGGRLSYHFKDDFKTLINPKNYQADWRWARSSAAAEEYEADGGTFLRKGFSSLDLVSLPFHKFISSNRGRLAGLSGYEAVLVNRQNFTVKEGGKLSARFSFSCRLFNEEVSPYPDNVVYHDDDDPTLINCAVSLGSYGDSSLVFSIVSTDEGIWAVYERNRFEMYLHPERNDREFTIFHKLGKRNSPYEIVDGGIQYDRRTHRVNYLINNEVVWYIDNIGELPPNESETSIYTKNRPDFFKVEPSTFQVWFGLTDYLDTFDPNAEIPGIRRQRLVDGDNYYDPKATFYDEVGKKDNSMWGQGGVMTLYDGLIQLQYDDGRNNNNFDN